MTPAIIRRYKECITGFKKSFKDSLCDEYHFEIKNDIKNAGARSLFYYKEEHAMLVSHVYSKRVHILNLETGKLRWFEHHETSVRMVTVCNNEIITASWDGTVCVTSFDSLKIRLILTEKAMGRCPGAGISQCNEFAYSYSYDSDKNPGLTSNTIRKWSLADGNLIRLLQLPGTHLSKRRCGSCEADGEMLFSVSDTGHLHIFNSNTGVLLSEDYFNEHLQSLCVLRDHKMIAIGGGNGNIYLYDFSDLKIRKKMKGHQYDTSHILVHPDKAELIISISFDGTMNIMNLPDLKLLKSVTVNKTGLWSVIAIKDLLITGGEDGDIWIYDIENLPEVRLKGKLVFSDESYALMTGELNSFFASNISMIQVRKKDNNNLLNEQFADYLLTTACDFRIFRDLFCPEKTDFPAIQTDIKGFYQLPQ
jgi:WD40 repeat protein